MLRKLVISVGSRRIKQEAQDADKQKLRLSDATFAVIDL
jgi:hypothetical protein